LPHVMPFASTVRLSQIPDLSVSQFLAFIRNAPVVQLRAVWDKLGADCKPRRWSIPRMLGTVDVHLTILNRIRPGDYAEPEEDPTPAVELPGPGRERVREYEERRAVENPADAESVQAKARANGRLGYAVFSRRDYTPAQAHERLGCQVHRLRNGHPVASEESLVAEGEPETGWTVAGELRAWREKVKPAIWPEREEKKAA